MNRRFLFLLTLTLCTAMTSEAIAFSDVEGHWAEKSIQKAEEMKVITGYENNRFMPDSYMTRAELVAITNRFLEIQSETDKYIPDVTRQDWFHSDVRKALSAGIIKGDANGYVRPNDYVTREEAAVIMCRAFYSEADGNVDTLSFKDNDSISSWSRADILTFVKKGYITGYPDGELKPKNNITRAEIITILERIIAGDIEAPMRDKKVNGNWIINQKNSQLRNVEFFGDLIIGETAGESLYLSNVVVNGNLVLYSPVDLQKNKVTVKGKIIKAYDKKIESTFHYTNSTYGVNFSLPTGAKVFETTEITSSVYDYDDVIIIDIKEDESYYFKDIHKISAEEIKSRKTDSIYKLIESDKFGFYPYEIYKDNANSSLLIIKRDNIVYSLLFINVVSDNILDNVISNIQFTNGERTLNYAEKIYRNSKLCLKFTYRDGYVGVDDSYNTGVIYSGDPFFKLFIQVNMITDIDEYSVEEVTALLKTLIKSDGTIVSQKISKISNHDAIFFEVDDGENKIISLYVIVGNNLYNFIFKGEKSRVDSLGKEMFLDIVSSMEF
mgnify:FL=1